MPVARAFAVRLFIAVAESAASNAARWARICAANVDADVSVVVALSAMNSSNWDDLFVIISSGAGSDSDATVGSGSVTVVSVLGSDVAVFCIVAVIVGMRDAFDGRWERETTAASAMPIEMANSKEQRANVRLRFVF